MSNGTKIRDEGMRVMRDGGGVPEFIGVRMNGSFAAQMPQFPALVEPCHVADFPYWGIDGVGLGHHQLFVG